VTKPSARAAPLAKATADRGRLAAAQAILAEIKAAKMRGELVEAAAVEAEWASVLRMVRAEMLAVPFDDEVLTGFPMATPR
jgi:phage terminase Nu1 subunit (DNA packaging protein)